MTNSQIEQIVTDSRFQKLKYLQDRKSTRLNSSHIH